MIKTYEDYIDKMCELFPEISRDDIYNIIKYGTKQMMTYITEEHDYAVTYKYPKSSLLISYKNDTGMTSYKKIKLTRKNH